MSPGMRLLFFLESPPVRLCDPHSVRGFLLRPLTPRVTGHFLVFILPDGTAGPAASRPPAHWRDARGSPLSRYLLVLLLPSPLLAHVPALSSSVGVPGSSLGPPFFLWLASALGGSPLASGFYMFSLKLVHPVYPQPRTCSCSSIWYIPLPTCHCIMSEPKAELMAPSPHLILLTYGLHCLR